MPPRYTGSVGGVGVEDEVEGEEEDIVSLGEQGGEGVVSEEVSKCSGIVLGTCIACSEQAFDVAKMNIEHFEKRDVLTKLLSHANEFDKKLDVFTWKRWKKRLYVS